MKFKILISILFLQLTAYSQNAEFISIFEPKSLPECVTYADSLKAESIMIKEYHREESLLLDSLFVIKHLTPQNKPQPGQGMQGDFDIKFYAKNLISIKKLFYVVTYERIIDNTFENAETYVCTITKKGKCISQLLFASSIYSGTGSLEDGGRFPYYQETEGCVDSNLIITINSNSNQDSKYKIKDDGKIVEIK